MFEDLQVIMAYVVQLESFIPLNALVVAFLLSVHCPDAFKWSKLNLLQIWFEAANFPWQYFEDAAVKTYEGNANNNNILATRITVQKCRKRRIKGEKNLINNSWISTFLNHSFLINGWDFYWQLSILYCPCSTKGEKRTKGLWCLGAFCLCMLLDLLPKLVICVDHTKRKLGGQVSSRRAIHLDLYYAPRLVAMKNGN